MHALLCPVNLVVGAAVSIAAIVLTPWLFAVAAGSHLALAAIVFFDESEAVRAAAGRRGHRRPGAPG